MRALPLLLLMLMLAACASGREAPAAPFTVVQTPSATVEEPRPEPRSEVPPPADLPPCERGWAERRPYAPTDPSPVRAEVFIKEDPGIAAPVMALVPELPITVVVRFDQAVDRPTFRLALTDTRCDYQPGPIDQETRWLSDREAEITVRTLPFGKPGPYGVTFGHGRDPAGKEVVEVRFAIGVEKGRRVRVYAVPISDGESRILFDRVTHLDPRSVSPDGCYILLARDIWALANTHSPVRIPYVMNLEKGTLTAYSRGDIQGIRWDLPNRALWVSGWQRLTLDGAGDTGRSLLESLPKTDGFLLNAQVSPDGRWLAALQSPVLNDTTGKADFTLVELATGKSRTLKGAFGYLEPPNGPPASGMVWSPDSRSLLIDSYRRGATPYTGNAEPVLLDPVTMAYQPLPVKIPSEKVLQFSPTRKYRSVQGVGIIARDGRVVRKELPLTGSWTPDDRLFIGESGGTYTVIDVETGKSAPLRLPPELAGVYPYPLGLSADGALLYLVREDRP